MGLKRNFYEKILLVILILLGQTRSLSCQINEKDFPILKGPYLGQEPPDLKPKIFAPGVVSTEYINHSTICISPDGIEIFWAMAPLDTPSRIYFSKNENGIWTKPKIISFTESEDGDCPVLSPDGGKLFFNSNRPISLNSNRRERIWCVERIPGGWGIPFPLGSEINADHLHWQISVDRDGNLYFGSERSGSKGRDDVFIAEYINKVFKNPYSLSSEINSEDHEGTPYISPDGAYLIFCRNGLRISFKQNNGLWTKSVYMGDNFKNGICPYVSPDGKYIFFLEMGMGHNDVYWASAKIIEEIRNKVLK